MASLYSRIPFGVRMRQEWAFLRRGWVRFHVLTLRGWALYEDRWWRAPIVFFAYLFATLKLRALKARG